jgi:hypothetical protein
MVTNPKGLGHEKDHAGDGQQYIQKTDTILSSERASHRNKTVTVKE